MKNKFLLIVPFLLSVFILLSSCSKDIVADDIEGVTITQGALSQTIFADSKGDNVIEPIFFTTTGSWTAKIVSASYENVDWIILNPSSGTSAGKYTLKIATKENYTGVERKASIVISSGEYTKTIEITQAALTQQGKINQRKLKSIVDTWVNDETNQTVSTRKVQFTYDEIGKPIKIVTKIDTVPEFWPSKSLSDINSEIDFTYQNDNINVLLKYSLVYAKNSSSEERIEDQINFEAVLNSDGFIDKMNPFQYTCQLITIGKDEYQNYNFLYNDGYLTSVQSNYIYSAPFTSADSEIINHREFFKVSGDSKINYKDNKVDFITQNIIKEGIGYIGTDVKNNKYDIYGYYSVLPNNSNFDFNSNLFVDILEINTLSIWNNPLIYLRSFGFLGKKEPFIMDKQVPIKPKEFYNKVGDVVNYNYKEKLTDLIKYKDGNLFSIITDGKYTITMDKNGNDACLLSRESKYIFLTEIYTTKYQLEFNYYYPNLGYGYKGTITEITKKSEKGVQYSNKTLYEYQD